jgi:hypothetical protein
MLSSTVRGLAFTFNARCTLGALTVGYIHKVAFLARFTIISFEEIIANLASTTSPAQSTLASNSTIVANDAVATEVAERI